MSSVGPPPGAILSSPSNPRVKSLVKLRQRRAREETGLTLVDGLREIRRALGAGVAVEAAYVGPSASRGDGPEVLLELTAANVPIIEVSKAVEARLAFGDRIEGVVAVVRTPAIGLDRLQVPAEPLVVVLERVEKPGNLGAVLRSVDGAGGHALIAADPLADLWSPNVIRASLGTIFTVPAAAADAEAVLEWCRARSIRLVAARVDAARTYTDADLTGPLALILGSEATGLTAAWHRPEVDAVRLPMHGVADSLNVSVAAAILLYEARRQRDASAARGDRATPPDHGPGHPA